jgi:hypothetical protein
MQSRIFDRFHKPSTSAAVARAATSLGSAAAPAATSAGTHEKESFDSVSSIFASLTSGRLIEKKTESLRWAQTTGAVEAMVARGSKKGSTASAERTRGGAAERGAGRSGKDASVSGCRSREDQHTHGPMRERAGRAARARCTHAGRRPRPKLDELVPRCSRRCAAAPRGSETHSPTKGFIKTLFAPIIRHARRTQKFYARSTRAIARSATRRRPPPRPFSSIFSSTTHASGRQRQSLRDTAGGQPTAGMTPLGAGSGSETLALSQCAPTRTLLVAPTPMGAGAIFSADTSFPPPPALSPAQGER